MIREGKDYAVVLADATGRLVACPSDVAPSFMGTLPITLRHFLDRYPANTLKPGDSLITNDPWLGTGHLSDISIATPIFDRNGRLFAWSACTAHVPDIGGSLNYGATREIYEEGLLIPVMKLEREEVPNEDLLAFIRNNVRVPDQVVGDIMAMLAANQVASRRVRELTEAERIDDFEALSSEIIQRTDEAMRRAIGQVPEGTYRASSTGDGFAGQFTVTASIKVSGGEIVVDFEGTSPQSESSLNAVYAYTYAYTVYPFKCLLQPNLPLNHGTLLPITVIAPEGCILNAQRPVAVDKRNLVGHFIVPTVFHALAEVLPDRVMADSGSTPAQPEAFTGVDRKGRHFVQLVHHVGAMGGSPHHDGEVACFPSNLGSTPVEVVEAQTPLLITEKRLLTDTAGAGRYRGGPAQRVTTRNVAPGPVMHNIIPCRFVSPPQGILGGQDAGVYHLYLNGEPHPHPQGRWHLQPGDEVTVEYPGGAGLGPVRERSRELVIADVLDEIVSVRAAREVYGVDIEQGARTPKQAEQARAGGSSSR